MACTSASSAARCPSAKSKGMRDHLVPSLPLCNVLCGAQFVFPQLSTWLPQKHRTKRRNWSPSSIILGPHVVEFREIRSAPTPPMDTTVALGSGSVIVCNTCATHSHPVFALKACWKKRCCLFYLLGNLFFHGKRHEPPHGVPIDSSPGASIWLAQCSEASQSEPCQNFCGDVSCGLGRTDPSHGLIPKQAKGGQTSTPMDQPRFEKTQNQVVPNGSGA